MFRKFLFASPFTLVPALCFGLDAPPTIQFERTYDFGVNEFATDLTATESGFVIRGRADTIEAPRVYEQLEVQLNPQGDVLDSQRTPTPVYEDMYGGAVALELDNGSTIVIGRTADGVRVALAKYSGNGIRDWFHEYDPGGWGLPQSCQLLADGGFLVLGTVYGVGGDINYKEDVMLLRTDNSGNQVWLKSYGEPGSAADRGVAAIPTPTGFVVIASSPSEVAFVNDAVAMVINQDGTLAQAKSIGNETEVPETPLFASVTGAGTVMVVGQAGYYYSDGSYQDNYPFLVEVAADGGVLWYRSYKDGDDNVITHVTPTTLIRTGDGGNLVAGYSSIFEEHSPAEVYLTKYDRLGEQVWRQTLTSAASVHRLIATPQGGYAVLGSVANDGPSYDIFVALLNPDGKLFVRGDCNGDGTLDISDPIRTLSYLFAGGVYIACLDAADANDDGRVDISDAIHSLSYLFTGGKDIPPPTIMSGMDPTTDQLGCGLYQSTR